MEIDLVIALLEDKLKRQRGEKWQAFVIGVLCGGVVMLILWSL